MAFNSQMHERNIYKNRPDFAQIALNYPEFRKYALCDAKGKVRVDFTDPDALRILTKILLKKDFNLTVDIPKGFLIPTIPQRLNYILWMEDMLSILANKNKIIRGVDIGCGPCAIFSILGAKKNGWTFTSTETSQEALQCAIDNINANNLSSLIKVVKVESNSTLSEVLSSKEVYDFCLCNPPFFENMEDIRKKSPKVKESITKLVKEEEIFSEGGEVAFVKKIIDESLVLRDRIKLYTSMFGKKKSFVEITKVLQSLNDVTVTKTQFCQGNTIRWGVAWTFDKSVNFEIIEKPKPKKSKKVKPPLLHHVPKDIKCCSYNVQELSKIIWNTLKDLEILIKVVRVHEHYTESQITTDTNTWSHQRRRRREMSRKVENSNLSPIEVAECELIGTNSDSNCIKTAVTNATTSISKTVTSDEQISETSCFDASKSQSLLAEKDLKIVASEQCSTSPNIAFKKLKLDEDDFENCEKSQLDLDLSKESEQPMCESISQCSNAEKCDANDLKFAPSYVLKVMEIVTGSESPIKRVDYNKSDSVKNEATNLVITEDDDLFVENAAVSYNSDKKRKLSGNEFKDSKKSKLDFDQSKHSEPIVQCSKDISPDKFDSNQLNVSSSHFLKESKQKTTEIFTNAESTVPGKDLELSERVKNRTTNLIKAEDVSDKNFEPKSLLLCTLKIRKAKDFVVIEMNCPDEANRESMYQIFQYLKNKLH